MFGFALVRVGFDFDGLADTDSAEATHMKYINMMSAQHGLRRDRRRARERALVWPPKSQPTCARMVSPNLPSGSVNGGMCGRLSQDTCWCHTVSAFMRPARTVLENAILTTVSIVVQTVVLTGTSVLNKTTDRQGTG